MAIVLTPGRIRAARGLAMLADLLQIVVFPAFAEGVMSPLNDALDLAVGASLVALVGWHWAFLPSFFSELIPFWDLVPTWTAAVWLVTSEKAPEESREVREINPLGSQPPRP
jgi:hypothetical protein